MFCQDKVDMIASIIDVRYVQTVPEDQKKGYYMIEEGKSVLD
jgi:hypothetical protein